MGTAPPRDVMVCAFPFMVVPIIVMDAIVDAGLLGIDQVATTAGTKANRRTEHTRGRGGGTSTCGGQRAAPRTRSERN